MVFVQSWDGAPNHVVRELLNAGRLPNLARLRDHGLWSEKGLVPAFPSQTAPGHARLWTGAPERVNGITGNVVLKTPRGEHTILEGESGFDGSSLRAEPMWITAARQGKNALVWNAPQAYPYPPLLTNDPAELASVEQHLRIVHGYGDPVVPSSVMDVSDLGTGSRELALGPLRIRLWSPTGLPSGTASTSAATGARQGADPSQIRVEVLGADAARRFDLSDAMGGPPQFSSGLLLPDVAPLFLRLFPVAGGGHRLYYTAASPARGNGRELLARLVDEGGGMILNGPTDLYLRGAFGPTLLQGGSGLAEACYLDVIAELLELNRRSITALLESRRWDLVVNYLPIPDEALHLWYGFVDKDLAPRNRELARKIRPLVEQVFTMLDAHLGAILQRLEAQDSFFLVSDHGMEGCDRDLLVNEALRRGGYLAVDPQGNVDLKHTRAYYGPGNAAWVVLNTSDWQEGIVHPEEVPAVSEEVGRFVMSLKDPTDGTPLVQGVFLPLADSRDYGGETAGQIYVDTAPGVNMKNGLGHGQLVERFPPSGRHMFYPLRPEMLAILFARSPKLPARAIEGPVSQLALAPMVCKILGIEPAVTMTDASLLDLAKP
jgi:type I phosphodiesterase/nucleotide pyrophosphatase